MYGTNGCIPAVVKSTVGSFSGIRDLPDICIWFFSIKNSMYFFRNSFAFIALILCKLSLTVNRNRGKRETGDRKPAAAMHGTFSAVDISSGD